jgi:phospholipid/cholesterol/gamma-HCH transport system substrate-binding protein
MNTGSQNFKVRLGFFVVIGLGIFVLAIFLIGKQTNMFDPVFRLNTTFSNVSGLQVGSNVRFSGINVGTVDNIFILNDSTVMVEMYIKRNVQKFIKTDCIASIGTEGIIGDRVLVISHGRDPYMVKNGGIIGSSEPFETDALMGSLKTTTDNAAIVSGELADILIKINSGTGLIGQLLEDSALASEIDKTVLNLRQSSQGLNENMKAVRENFLFRRYFKKKEKEEKKKQEEAEKKKKEEVKKKKK